MSLMYYQRVIMQCYNVPCNDSHYKDHTVTVCAIRPNDTFKSIQTVIKLVWGEKETAWQLKLNLVCHITTLISY